MDTIQLSRKLNDYNGHSMAKLCEKYNINNYDAHRAMGDVLTLMDIYVLLSNVSILLLFNSITFNTHISNKLTISIHLIYICFM